MNHTEYMQLWRKKNYKKWYDYNRKYYYDHIIELRKRAREKGKIYYENHKKQVKESSNNMMVLK